jgi:Flp pilus assembly protein TadD
MRCLCVLAIAVLCPLFAIAEQPKLDRKRLEPSLKSLTRSQRGVIDGALELIRKGEHTAALARLTELSRDNPNNSGTRIVLAYALLQAGNLAGAFDHAAKAEAAPGHDSYACLFLARIAYLVGDTARCRRELGHVREAGGDPREVESLERRLASKNNHRP